MRMNILLIISVILSTLCTLTYASANTVAEPTEKMIALTFDDGPHPKYTPLVLDVLKKHNARATFFMVGERAEKLPEIVLRTSLEGHSIGNHTYNHTELTRLNDRGIISQISRTNKAIEGITGARPVLMRPPLGARNKHIDYLIKNQNMYNIMWNVDPVDWDHKGAQLIHNRVVNKIQSGDIVIMHDFYPNTVIATDMILSTLKAQGYRFVTVDEILGLFEDMDENASHEDVYYNGRSNTWSKD